MTQQVVRLRYIVHTTNVAMDDVSVDFILEATGSDTGLDFATMETPGAAIDAFWNTASGTHPVAYYMSNQYSGATTLEWYDITDHLDGSAAGAPFRIDVGTAWGTRGSTTDLHPALAGVLAYRRDYGTDQEHGPGSRPRARDRGRLYLGPCNQSAMQTGTGDGQISDAFREDIVASAAALAATKNALSANQFNWVQWSRKNASVAPIADVATQFGFGIQRRRTDEQSTRVLPWQAI